MTVTFKFEKEESTASPIYRTYAVDETGNVLMTWQIVCDDESKLESIAAEAYAQAIANTVILNQQGVA